MLPSWLSARRLFTPQTVPVLLITVLLAGVRLWAVSATIWDWDEALFVLGMRDYDVGAHHPHPPGFPVYIFLARTVRCLVGSDVAALQIVVVAFAIALFPVMVMLVRTLGFERETALLASTIYCTLPNQRFRVSPSAIADSLRESIVRAGRTS